MREAAARVTAANNFRQVGLAMDNYAASHRGRLPPAVVRDKEGKPLYSWRVLLLPYLDEDRLYQEFHLDEPWDSPHNRMLLPRMPRAYHLPTDLPIEPNTDPSLTYCQVFVGKGTAFEDDRGAAYPEDFHNGTANTILATEAGEAVPWTKPVDLTYQPDGPLPSLGGVFTGESRFSLFGSNRKKGFHVLFADGSVRFITPPVEEQTLRDTITREGGRHFLSE